MYKMAIDVVKEPKVLWHLGNLCFPKIAEQRVKNYNMALDSKTKRRKTH